MCDSILVRKKVSLYTLYTPLEESSVGYGIHLFRLCTVSDAVAGQWQHYI